MQRRTEWDVTKSRNGEPGTGVWERVCSGNSHEKSKWLTKPSKESEFNCDMIEFRDLSSLLIIQGDHGE